MVVRVGKDRSIQQGQSLELPSTTREFGDNLALETYQEEMK